MWDILRDQIWNFIGVLVAVVAILTSIVLYGKQRRRKALSYEIISQTPLTSVKEEIGKDVQILYKGKLVQQVYLIEVRIINSGNTPIEEDHYTHPISLSFGEEAQILTAEVAEKRPSSLRASVVIEGKKIVLLPTLLNEKDSVKLRALVNGFDKINVDGRIVGVKTIEEFVEGTSFWFLLLSGMAIFLLGVIFLALSTYWLYPWPPIQNIVGLASLLLLVLGGGRIADGLARLGSRLARVFSG